MCISLEEIIGTHIWKEYVCVIQALLLPVKNNIS